VRNPSGGRKVSSDAFGRKKSAVGYLFPFGKGIVELILRDCTVTWLKQKGRMDG
jgi:hypothetical protein